MGTWTAQEVGAVVAAGSRLGATLEFTDGPKVPGLEPIFRHLDDPDVPWQQVRSVRLSDGTVASVREKWSAFSADPLYLSLYRACLRTGP